MIRQTTGVTGPLQNKENNFTIIYVCRHLIYSV